MAAIRNHQDCAHLIAYCRWNDPDGCYSDADSAADGLSPVTLEQLRAIIRDWMRDSDICPAGIHARMARLGWDA